MVFLKPFSFFPWQHFHLKVEDRLARSQNVGASVCLFFCAVATNKDHSRSCWSRLIHERLEACFIQMFLLPEHELLKYWTCGSDWTSDCHQSYSNITSDVFYICCFCSLNLWSFLSPGLCASCEAAHMYLDVCASACIRMRSSNPSTFASMLTDGHPRLWRPSGVNVGHMGCCFDGGVDVWTLGGCGRSICSVCLCVDCTIMLHTQ